MNCCLAFQWIRKVFLWLSADFSDLSAVGEIRKITPYDRQWQYRRAYLGIWASKILPPQCLVSAPILVSVSVHPIEDYAKTFWSNVLSYIAHIFQQMNLAHARTCAGPCLVLSGHHQ